MNASDKAGDVGNGKVILLYDVNEEANFATPMIQDILIKNGIIPLGCNNPNNFRFVVPEIVPATSVDLIGRLALQSLGEDKPVTAFGNAIRKALAPVVPPTITPTKTRE